MDKIKEGLIRLFDGMLLQVGSFKRKTYKGVFEQGYETYKEVVSDILTLYEGKTKEEQEKITDELSDVLPDYAYGKLQTVPKMKRERASIDYNMNMVVYVVPVLTYTKDENLESLAEKTVERWNEKKMNSLTLSISSYETIAGGFKNGFCYITTAVCRYQGKPDDCYELTVLRRYRDTYLLSSEEGRRLVGEYYDTAPYLVKVLEMCADMREIYDELYRVYLSPCVSYIEQKKYEECKRVYIDMVRGLQAKYLFSQEVNA